MTNRLGSAFAGIDAVAFDLDGTLYPDWRLWLASGIPFAFSHGATVAALGKARVLIRNGGLGGANGPEFMAMQAGLVASFLNVGEREAGSRLAAAYAAWEKAFARVKPYRCVRESLEALGARGLKLAVLSDFPPRVKLEAMGLSGSFGVALSSEDSGRLKPRPEPFLMLARALGAEPGRILYVGDSPGRDVAGARAAGMKTALLAFKAPSGARPGLVFSRWSEFLTLAREINR